MRSIDPTTGETFATYPQTTAKEAAGHIRTAHHLQRAWGQTPLAHRCELALRLADVLESRREGLAILMAREMGKPVTQGRGEVDKCAWTCRYYADEAAAILADVPISADRTSSYVSYRPLGVILGIMPWNFPLWQVIRFLAPTLTSGNGVILKHASNVTGCAIAIDEMVVEAGYPDGLFRTVVVPSSEVGAMISNPHIAAVTLTGSEEAGRAVASAAGLGIKKSVLELGGSDAAIVLEDADLDLAVAACTTSRLLNGGQSCIAAKRFVVHENVVDEFTSKLTEAFEGYRMSNPLDDDAQIGPMARIDLRDELHEQVERSVAVGAVIVTGGSIPDGPGAFYPPTILTNVQPGMAAYHEEMFGPVASIITVASEEEAIAVANSSKFGLGASVFTRDQARGERIARDHIEAGSCFVNAFVASDPRLPFGGVKASGYGRELSHQGMREFVNVKTVVVG
ncbi:MAG: NAD-dependent succinate-semialdehyde dehydrogenase [Acidimicrobiia bacterium]|nr:MAG: NAD-dependent succinate-semialdehyde dehydrogenase [Acidimicrobiia bacterium]